VKPRSAQGGGDLPRFYVPTVIWKVPGYSTAS
jgi:hypothetical protein